MRGFTFLNSESLREFSSARQPCFFPRPKSFENPVAGIFFLEFVLANCLQNKDRKKNDFESPFRG